MTTLQTDPQRSASASAQAGQPAAGDHTPSRHLSELIAVWCGPAAVVFFGIGFMLGGLIPPASPADSAADVVGYYSEHDLDARRAGVICLCVGCILFIPFAAAIATQLRRIEGPGSPLAATQIAAGAVTAALGIVYSMMMMSILFRLDRSPETTQAMNDLAWVPFVGVWQPSTLQAIVLGLGVLMDRRAVPTLPRWLGYFSIWYALAALTGTLTGFFHDGPFAWNGAIAFYIAASLFFFWYIAIFVVLRRSVRSQPLPDSVR